MSNTIRNARINLLASLLNAMATTCFAVGIAATAAAVFYGQGSIPLQAVVIGAIVWTVPVVILHGLAQIVLGGLRQ